MTLNPTLFNPPMTLVHAAALLSVVVLTAGTTVDSSSRRISQLRWLSGCWEERDARSTVEEFWTTPNGGMLFGVGRTIIADSTRSFELMRIYARDGKLVFAAHPSGQQPAEFREMELTDSAVVFANPAHDFPQFVRYRRRGTNELHARVDGKMDGKDRGFDAHYRRVSCPG